MSIRRDERGQSVVMAVVFMAALLAMSAAVLDLGSWFRADRRVQATADAAALAGAQALPDDPSSARALALDYAKRNGDTITDTDVTLSSTLGANDTIEVGFSRPAPGFFSKVLGISSVDVGAKAKARAFLPGQARWVAPIVVNKLHPKLAGTGCPCFGPLNATTLPLAKTGAPGAFDMLNLDPEDETGTVGTSVLAAWIEQGFDEYLPLGGYYSDPGAKWNSTQIQQALHDRFGTEMLFPVYDTLTGTGSNATYHIVAWVGFHLTGVTATGTGGTVSGWFTRVIWDGIDPVPGGPQTEDLGVRSVQLVQ
jgi:hypothetical protein